MRKSEVVLCVALLASVAMSGWLWSELRAERSRNVALTKSASAQQRVAAPRAESIPVAPAVPATAVPAPSNPGSTTVAAAAQAPTTVVGTEEDWQRVQRRLMSDPRYREAWREQRRLNFALRRDNIIRLLGLTPEQAAAVIDLQIDRELAYLEGRVSHPGDAANAQQRAKDRENAIEQDHKEKLQALLGSQKYAGLEQYMESRPSRMQVDQFRTQLAGADMLREDQVEPLIAALHVEHSQMRRELTEYRDTLNWEGTATDTWRLYNEREAELRKAAHVRMHDAAAAILSSSQLAKFDDLLRREQQRRETQQRMEGLQAKLGGASAYTKDPD
jgi:type II secretory pathway pseudopilin PulG